MASKRPTIIAGNWKMYKTIDEALAFIDSLASDLSKDDKEVYLAVPFTAIRACAERAKDTPVTIGAQNMNDASKGAFTGEIAARMLVDAGAQFVLLGHSERRHVFGEESVLINRKVLKAFEEGLQPIVCVGETHQEREDGRAEEVIATQLKETLANVSKTTLKSMILAYEPVWAIGTGNTASPKDAQAMHALCRTLLEEVGGKRAAAKIPILYGGSVNPNNTASLLDQKDIDGVLVGGASLAPESFSQIIHYTHDT